MRVLAILGVLGTSGCFIEGWANAGRVTGPGDATFGYTAGASIGCFLDPTPRAVASLGLGEHATNFGGSRGSGRAEALGGRLDLSLSEPERGFPLLLTVAGALGWSRQLEMGAAASGDASGGRFTSAFAGAGFGMFPPGAPYQGGSLVAGPFASRWSSPGGDLNHVGGELRFYWAWSTFDAFACRGKCKPVRISYDGPSFGETFANHEVSSPTQARAASCTRKTDVSCSYGFYGRTCTQSSVCN